MSLLLGHRFSDNFMKIPAVAGISFNLIIIRVKRGTAVGSTFDESSGGLRTTNSQIVFTQFPGRKEGSEGTNTSVHELDTRETQPK